MRQPNPSASSDGAGPRPIQPGVSLADGAASAAVHGVDLGALYREIEQLKAALQSRTTIGSAVGVLVANYRITPERAFALLVRWSQHRNIKLWRIAETLVAVAVHGPEAPEADPALALWLSEQLTASPLTARANSNRSRARHDGNGATLPSENDQDGQDASIKLQNG